MTQKAPTSQDFAEFRFTPESLSKPRKPGISAYMRVKNDEQFVALAILSHIDYFDEIIACYNDCTDNSEKILRQLAAQHPKKIKVYHYLPKVYLAGSEGNRNAAYDSVHGVANCYNYALSKTTYSIATKLAAKHLAIACNLARLTATIRRDLAAGKKKIYQFSGINLACGKDLGIGIFEHEHFHRNSELLYHPVEASAFFYNADFGEVFNAAYRSRPKKQSVGTLYFHLKYLKGVSTRSVTSFDQLQTAVLRHKLRRQRRRFSYLRYFLFRSKKYALADELKDIDFKRDVIDRLDGLLRQKEVVSQEFAEFRFNPESLSKPRKPGISGYMRIKNEEQFLALAILSHIDYYDEIIACYNDCTDNTEKILRQLAAQYPHKIKVYHYLPKVHPIDSEGLRNVDDDSVHSLANYYNYALSKTTYSVAVKLDADHLAISQNLAPAIATIRRDLAAGKKKMYQFSGINLMREKGLGIGVFARDPFAAKGEHMYHPVAATAFYFNFATCERFNEKYRENLERKYMGIVYFHLKYLKKDFGWSNYSANNPKISTKEEVRKWLAISFDEFRTTAFHKNLLRQREGYYSYLQYFLSHHHRNKKMLKLIGAMSKKKPRLLNAQSRLLTDDLKEINFERDAIDRLAIP